VFRPQLAPTADNAFAAVTGPEHIRSAHGIATVGARLLVAGTDCPRTPLGQNLARGCASPRRHPSSRAARPRQLHRNLVAVRTGRVSPWRAGAQNHVGPHRTAAAVYPVAPFVTPLFAAAAELQAVCDAQHWRFCFIGGLAVLRWGEPRETIDVDLTLLTGFGDEDRFIAPLIAAFEPRIPDAAAFAHTNRVLLLRAASGVGLDIALAGLPFEESVVDRSSLFTYPPDRSLRTCSAEDLIVLKAFADRAKDWMDIEGIIVRQSIRLDWDYVRRQFAPLAELKDAPDLVEKLESTRQRLRD